VVAVSGTGTLVGASLKVGGGTSRGNTEGFDVSGVERVSVL
jgi:hypothetical protein